MAAKTVTVANTDSQLQALSLGNVKARLVTLTFDDGADATSIDLDPSDVGLHEFVFVMCSVDQGDNGTVDGIGWLADFDYQDNQVNVFGGSGGAGDQFVLPDESLQDVQVRVLALGF